MNLDESKSRLAVLGAGLLAIAFLGGIVWLFFFMPTANRDWEDVLENPSIDAFRAYIERWPTSKHRKKAQYELAKLLRQAWDELGQRAADVSREDAPGLASGARLPGKAVVMSWTGHRRLDEETKLLPGALRAAAPGGARVVLLYREDQVGAPVAFYKRRKGGFEEIPGYKARVDIAAVDVEVGKCLGTWSVTVSPPYKATVQMSNYQVTTRRILGNTRPEVKKLLASFRGP